MDQQVWTQIIDALVTILLVAAMPLVLKGFQWLLVRVKLDQNTAVQAAVRTGIAYAEEYAARQMKASGSKIASRIKLDMAVSQVIQKLPGVTDQEAKDLVQGQLAQVGLGASNFLQATATAMQSPKP